jgi:hypothetical protein
MKTSGLIAAIAGVFVLVFPAAAQAPVAVVEDVTGSSAGVEFMDFVEAGRVIRLGARDSIVLSYLKFCTRERITGGTITVGAEHSEVQAGIVERTKEQCDVRKMMLSSQEATQAAGLVLRRQPPPVPEPQFTLYGASPIVELKGGGTLVIDRLDKAGERHVQTIADDQQGAYFDFADAGKSLMAGGVYRAVAGTRQLIFRIDRHAKAGYTPIIGRLLRFGRAG